MIPVSSGSEAVDDRDDFHRRLPRKVSNNPLQRPMAVTSQGSASWRNTSRLPLPAIPVLSEWVRRRLSRPSCLELRSLPAEINRISLTVEHSERQGDQGEVYLIRQPVMGRGMFSLVSSVVCHLHAAERFGLTPVVDFSAGYPTEYNDPEFEAEDERGRNNAWEYYFQPVSALSLTEAHQCSRILASTRSFPDQYPLTISHVQELRDLTCRAIKPQPEILADVENFWQANFSSSRVLGVHHRGQEQKTMPYHPLSPTNQQMVSAIDQAIDQLGFDAIFAVSEDADHLEALQARYGHRLVCMPHFRTRSPVNAYRIKPRRMHKYLLGREILSDALILARCHGLVSGPSTVNEFCRCINNGRYDLDLVIDNGFNATDRRFAQHLWTIKNRLPASWGGFADDAIKPFPTPT
jgi:hypothetical protein